MARRPVVVDGSNLATEGRSMPSLAQLDEAVRAWLAENPDDEVIVVVDASFSYRIDESERRTFEEAEEAGEVVSPPAGAVGRGDGFLLRIADRVDAAVLSNDSFQEFHGEYKWLFDSGRLLGGKPVPNVGWIFTPRTPVRGPKSRMAVRDAQRATKGPRSAPVVKAIAQATAEAIDLPRASNDRRPRRRGGRSAESAPVTSHEAVNEPLPFVTFIAGHPLGTEVEGTVVSFTSHGAFVEADGARCYVPVVGLGDPPPRTAKAVLKSGEVRTFVVQALDPPRRGIELALPEVAHVAGAPTDETVEADIRSRVARRSMPQRSVAGIPPPPRGRRSPIAAPARARADAEGAPEGPPGADQPEATPIDAASIDSMEPIAPVESEAEPAAASPGRSPRRRRPAAAAVTEPAGAEPAAAEPAAAEGADGRSEPEAARPRRRAVAGSAAAAATPPVEGGPGPRARRSTKKAADAEAAAVAPAAPRSRRPAKNVAPGQAETLPPVDAGTLLAETTEKAPLRAPRTRKRAAPTTAAGPSTVPDSGGGSDAPVAVDGTVAVPTRRTAKRAAGVVDAGGAEAAAETGGRAPAKRAAATKAQATKAQATKAQATKAQATKAQATKAQATKAQATKA
ncbi:MAG: NYN domain-containing protein, partial [Acidimicrobiales bacterium]